MDTSLFRRPPATKRPSRILARYSLALAACAAALAVCFPMRALLARVPFAGFFLVSCLVAWYVGLGPALLAVLVGFVLATYYLQPPYDTLFISAQEIPIAVMYVAVTTSVVAMLANLRRINGTLREKERQLSEFLENASVGLHWLDEDGHILWANKAYLDLLGYSAPEFVGRHISQFHAEASAAQSILRRTAANERLSNFETRLRAKDGSLKTVLLDSDLCFQQGQFLHARFFVRDITARREAEASQSRLASIIEATSDLVGIATLEGRVLYLNRAGRGLLGLPIQGDLSQRQIFDFHPESAKALLLQEAVPTALREGTWGGESALVASDGRVIPVLQVILANKDEEGQLQYVSTIIRDITERKRAEEALRKSEASLRLAQRVGRVGSWEVDLADGKVTWSDETYRIFGLSRSEITPSNDTFYSLVHPEDWEAVRRAGADALASGNWYSIDFRIRWRDGTEHFVTQQALVIRDAAGQALRLVGTVQDITERKQAEAAIQKLNAELEERVARRTQQLESANKELEAFSYSISHDLRAPLRAINGFMGMIQEYHASGLTGEGLRLLQVVTNSARRMNELIEDLLAFSRLNRREFQRAEVNVKQMMRSVIAEATQLADKKHQPSFNVHDLPEIHGDASMLRQVFVNLVSNAVKFSRRVPEPQVEIGVMPRDSEVVFFVRDNGVGFDMRYAAKLFKVFQRLHRADQFEGTGVGLAIVHQIVQRHGGRVWAEAAVNKGATFYFSLPRRNGELA
jgi:PAS domain S-box-containing protein